MTIKTNYSDGEQLPASDLNEITAQILANKNPSDVISLIKTAGESITGATTPQAVGIQRFASESLQIEQATTGSYNPNNYSSYWNGTTFLTDGLLRITKASLYIRRVGTVSTMTVRIYAVDGSNLPTGTRLAEKIIDVSALSTSYVWQDVVFDKPLEVDDATTYAIVMFTDGINSSNCVQWNGITPSQYAGGNLIYSTDTGGTWSAQATTYDLVFKIYGNSAGDGKIYKKLAGDDTIEYLGFTKDTVSADDSVRVINSGVISGFSGLTAFDNYYISDSTAGTIGTTETESLIGRAISSGEIALSQFLEVDRKTLKQKYIEKWQALTIPTIGWNVIDLSSYGVREGDLVEIMARSDTSAPYNAGARSVGSSLSRYIGAAYYSMITFNTIVNENLKIEIYSGNNTYLDFYLIGIKRFYEV